MLGLVTTIKDSGEIEFKAPLRRWKKKLTIDKILEKMGEGRTFERFFVTLLNILLTRVSYCFCCTQIYNEKI